MNIKFRYKDELSKGEWRHQKCFTGGIEECKRIYGLDDEDVEAYEILEVDGKLTREGKLEKVEKLNSNKRIQGVRCDEKLLQSGRDDSIWYGGEVLAFDVLDEKLYPRFRVKVLAEGETRLTIGDETVVKKTGCDSGDVVEFLESHGLKDDESIEKAESELGELEIGDRNWFEIEIYDKYDDKDILRNVDGWIIGIAFDVADLQDEILAIIDNRNKK